MIETSRILHMNNHLIVLCKVFIFLPNYFKYRDDFLGLFTGFSYLPLNFFPRKLKDRVRSDEKLLNESADVFSCFSLKFQLFSIQNHPFKYLTINKSGCAENVSPDLLLIEIKVIDDTIVKESSFIFFRALV